ncbi:POLY protein, partial [Buphagus erythrorhynchus]|nr:POLY protein [Buphagus erythrorhynchus]
LLADFQLGEGAVLVQYVDDLLIAGKEEQVVRQESIKLLNFLSIKELKVSKSKLQFVEKEVKYLGHRLSQGLKKLDPERVKRILAMPRPRTKREVRQLL